jgi:hypothetical protein
MFHASIFPVLSVFSAYMINKQTDTVPIRTVKAKNPSKLMKGYAHVEVRREVMKPSSGLF